MPKHNPIRTPMQGHMGKHGGTPKIAPNTTIPGSAPKQPTPVQSPMPVMHGMKSKSKR